MQSTVERPRAGLWHSLKVQYLVLACSVAVAASAALAADRWQGEALSSRELKPSVTSHSTVLHAEAVAPLRIYVVDSQERADQIARLVFEDEVALSRDDSIATGLSPHTRFMVIDSPAHETLLAVMVSELMALEQLGRPSPLIIDVR